MVGRTAFARLSALPHLPSFPMSIAAENIDRPLVLIVDDDEEIRSQMKWALLQDYDVLLAEDRVSSIAAFRESRPLVVVLDLGLPPSPSAKTSAGSTPAEPPVGAVTTRWPRAFSSDPASA